MESPASLPLGYRFGPYDVDLAAGQLRKRGVRLKLTGQPLDILIMLLERPGQVVTREELQRRLWSDETFVDFENSLNKAINKLRQTLGDSAEKPVYIETLPRRGYRFTAEVERLENGHAPQAVPALAIIPKRQASEEIILPEKSLRRKLILFPLAVLAVAAVAGVWIAARPLPKPRILKFEAMTTTARVDPFSTLQTDGLRLFFLQRRGHRWELSQMPASGGEIQPFSTPFPNAKVLAISPNGAEMLIAPFESRAWYLPLWIMPSVGGAPRRLGDFLACDAVFTPDGSKVTYVTQDGIFEIQRDGVNPKKLLDSSKGSIGGLEWSPDGRTLRFHWQLPGQELIKLWEINTDGGNPHEILKGWGDPNHCCGRWTRDGRYYFFVTWSTGVRPASKVWVVAEKQSFFHSTQEPVELTAGPLSITFPLPSPDGRRLFVLAARGQYEYARFDAESREFRGLLSGNSAAWLTFAPGADWVVYPGEGGNLWRSKLDGSERRALAGSALDSRVPAVSPDGRLVAFRGNPPGSSNSRIYVVPAEGGETTEVVAESFSVSFPKWSPDGSRLIYAADTDDGSTTGLYALDWKTRQKQKIPGSEPYTQPVLSPDSRYIAATSTTQSDVGIFDWTTHKWHLAARGKVMGPVAWSSDSQFLYFQDILEEDEPVRRLRVKDGTVELIQGCRPLLEGGVQRCGFEGLAPDGSMYFRLTRGDHDVYVLNLDVP